MASGLFGTPGSSSGGGLFKGTKTSTSSGPHTPSGVGGFFENLGTDIKGAVTGFIPGVVHTVEHPIATAEQLGKSEWQTWSPLFEGHIGTFGKDFYQHPLAPLLDVTAALDLGLSAAGEVGARVGAEEGSLLGRAAALKAPKTISLTDPTGEARLATKTFSTRPLRRLTQEHIIPRVVARMPSGIQDAATRAQFERAFRGDMVRRVVAKSAVVNAMLGAGKRLTEPETAAGTRKALLQRLAPNMHEHGFQMMPDQAAEVVARNKHYAFVQDPSLIPHRDHVNRIQVLRNKIATSFKLANKHAALGHSVDKIQSELDHQHATLKDMNENGYRIAAPAKTKLKEPTTRQLMERNAMPRVEVQRNIARLEKQLTKARRSKAVLDRAHEDINNLSGQLTTLQSKGMHSVLDHFSSSQERFDHFVQNYGRYGTTNDIRKAMVDQHGRVSLVPKHDAAMLGHELDNSSKMLRMLWRKPTRAWKMAVVGYTPRTVVNNTVGNLLIYLSREDPVSGLWGLYNGYRLAHGIDKADQHFLSTIDRQHTLQKYFTPDIVSNNFGADLVGEKEFQATGLKGRLKGGMYPLVHRVADMPTRIGAILSYLRRDPEVRALMKSGMSFDEAMKRALAENKHNLRLRTSEHARSIAGDYTNLAGWEKKIKDVVPFYLWDRHILRSTHNLLADNPARAVVGSRISQQGEKEVQKYFGTVPSYLAGMLPLSMLGLGGGSGDRQRGITTASLNPFNTIGDLAGVAQALTAGHTPNPGSDLFDQVNPMLTGLAEYASGQNLLSGAKLPRHGGAIPSVLFNTLQGIPEYRLANGMLTPPQTTTKTGKTKLYATGEQPVVSSFLGVPIQNISRSAAVAASNKETGVKTAKKKHFV